MWKKIYFFVLDSVQTVLIAASVFLVIYMFLLRPFQVSGHSMDPTFANGEYVLTNLIGLKFSNPKRGAVVVVHAPDDPEKDYIKRVIAIPGDTIYVQNGDVYLNNKKLNESAYLKSDVKTYVFGGGFMQEGVPVTVPPHNYFVMGDNRGFSKDSRVIGYIKDTEIIGQSFFVYWPLSQLRLIQDPK